MKKLKVLPPMQCDEGCGECCGMVPVTETEFQRVARYVKEKGIVPVEHTNDGEGYGTCPVYIDGKCSVYEVRPLICRVFGHAEGLPCARGHNVNVDQKQIDRMLRSNGQPTRLLHELVPGLAERARRKAAANSLKVL